MSRLTRRLLFVSAAILIAVFASLVLEVLLSLSTRWPFAHSARGHIVGWCGFAVILLTYLYSWKKRHNPKGVWPKNWFTLHMAAGILGPMIILVHSGWHLHALVPVLALIAMMGVVVSGVTGKAIHYAAVRMLSDHRRELTRQGLSPDQIELAVFEMAAQEETFRVWQIIHAPLAGLFMVLTLLHIAGAVFFGGI